MGKVDREKRVYRVRSNTTEVDRKTKDRVAVIDSTVVCVFGVGEVTVVLELGTNNDIFGGLMGKASNIFGSVVPVTPSCLITVLAELLLELAPELMVCNATSAGCAGGRS